MNWNYLKELWIICVFFLFSCTGEPPNSILVDKNFNLLQEGLIQEAADEWEEATDGGLTVDLLFDWDRGHAFTLDDARMVGDSGTMHWVPENSKEYEELTKEINDTFAGRTWYNYHYWSIAIAELSEGENWIKFKVVVMHELAHFLTGCPEHTETGIMKRSLKNNYEPCVDQESLDMVCEHVQCGPKARPTCE